MSSSGRPWNGPLDSGVYPFGSDKNFENQYNRPSSSSSHRRQQPHRGGSVSSDRGGPSFRNRRGNDRSSSHSGFHSGSDSANAGNSNYSAPQRQSTFPSSGFHSSFDSANVGNSNNSAPQRQPTFPSQNNNSSRGAAHSQARGDARPNNHSNAPRNFQRFENVGDILKRLEEASIVQLLEEACNPKGPLCRFLSRDSSCTNEQLAQLFAIFQRISESEVSPEMSIQFLIALIPSRFMNTTFVNFLSVDFIHAAHRISNFSVFIEHMLDVLIACFVRTSSLSQRNLLPVTIILERQMEQLKLDNNQLKEKIKRLTNFQQAASQLTANAGESTQLSRKEKHLLRQDAQLPPDDYRNISVFPTIEDIRKDPKEVFLRRNIVKGVYDSGEMYLDIHFRLMREDFIEPLRNGIQQYLDVTARARMDARHGQAHRRERLDLKVYPNVRISNSFPTRECGVVHDLKFNAENLKRVDWNKTKRLSYGSLICLSSDDFETMYFGAVVLREADDLKQGIVTIKFDERAPPRTGVYLMTESNVFFEAYRHTLTRLKQLNNENFPMADLLLGKFMTTNVRPTLPEYLARDATLHFDLAKFASTKTVKMRGGDSKFLVYPLGRDQWPHHEDLNMDVSQFAAFKNALTRNLSIIQGPPGCGKTYVGLKIVQCLLEICSRATLGPILVICYTNHALDQFLEGILSFCPTGIVRVGRRCKSEELEKFNISNLRQKVRRVAGQAMFHLYTELEEAEKTIEGFQRSAVKAQTAILTVNDLHNIIPENLQAQLNTCAKKQTQALTNWLLGYDRAQEDSFVVDLNSIAAGDVLECLLLQEIFSQANNIIEEFRFNLEDLQNELVEVDADFEEEQRDIFDDQRNISKARRNAKGHSDFQSAIYPDFETETGWCVATSRKSMKNMVKRRLRGHNMSDRDAALVTNVFRLDIDERWSLYNFWRSQYVRGIEQHSRVAEEEYERLVSRLQEVKQLQDMEIFLQSAVIGMTTTGAARYGRILSELQPRIVVVEEAAEVLESHIVTSLSRGTQHLILIGDHKQLRPNNAVYRLAKEYHLDVSLFERLIQCDYPFDTLALQHRMRPEISVLMKHIYPNLGNHPCVEKYEHIRGMAKDVFFLHHNHEESFNEECSSYSNNFEALFIVALCRYFLLNGYEASQITVLTLYTGQLFTIQRHMPKKEFYGVRVTVVDNFQGEENDIILLSLVRSNANDKIGFLDRENRICVALSRAKMGLYVIGNLELLSRQNSLWNKVVSDMRELGCCGDVLHLACQMHKGDPPIEVRSATDFNKAPEGGCLKICNERLACGHACRKVCHPTDREHELYKCQQRCARTCSKNNHPCTKQCFVKCGQCTVKVDVVLPACGHRVATECYKDIEGVSCTHPCQKLLPLCKHACDKLCGEPCSTQCRVQVKATLPFCGHTVHIDCHLKDSDLWKISCPTPCEMMLPCGHRCKGTCGRCAAGRLHQPCSERKKQVLVCGHDWEAKCYEENTSACGKQCMDSCSHNVCTRPCGEPCNLCKEPCRITCPHRSCSKSCSDPCEVGPCDEPCPKTFQCRKCHQNVPCVGLCGELCPKKCRNCDGEKLTEIFFGTEDEEDARYLLLPKCRHVVEKEGMDEYIRTLLESDTVQSINCPRCKSPITKLCTQRYIEEVKKCQLLRNLVVKKDLKKNSSVNPSTLAGDWASFEAKLTTLSTAFSMYSAFSRFRYPTKFINYQTSFEDLSYYKTLLECLQQIYDIHSSFSKIFTRNTVSSKDTAKRSSGALYQHLHRSFYLLISFVMEKNRRFGPITVGAYEAEMNRIECMLAFAELEAFLEGDPNEREKLNKEVESLYHVSSQLDSQISADKKKIIMQLVQTMKKKYVVPGLGVTRKERDQIVAAIGLSKGHWFKCPQGHVYCIADCGGAMQQAKCPECGATIGGMNHQLERDNRLAPEMDGARHPAFSNENYEANLAAIRRMVL